MIEHRILFVCLGNISRSPMAEGVFRQVVEEHRASEHFLIDSAGTGAWHVGEPPDTRAQQAVRLRGIDISGQRARRVAESDFERFDALLAMDEDNREALLALAPAVSNSKVRLFLEFAPEAAATAVPDPYYGGPEGFDCALGLIEAASRGLFRALAE